MILKHEQSISHLRRAAGKDSPLVYRSRQGVTDGYERPDPVNPNTSDQQLSRQAWSRSCAAWKELSAEQKAEWNSYGAAHGHHFSERRSAEPLTGYRVFHAAAGNRQILGLSLPINAPGQLRPEVPTRVELLPPAEAGTLRLRIKHKLKGEAFRVLVSMSPATVRVSRKPDRRAGRHVRGWGQASTAPLPESGGEIVFTNCRYTIEPGRRFGVWLRIIRESDGLASPELFLDLLRPEPEPLLEPATAGGDELTGSVNNTPPQEVQEAAPPVPARATAAMGASFPQAGEGTRSRHRLSRQSGAILRLNQPARRALMRQRLKHWCACALPMLQPLDQAGNSTSVKAALGNERERAPLAPSRGYFGQSGMPPGM